MSKSFILEPSVLAQWHALIQEAQHKTEQKLNEDLESYLAFLLMRFTEKPDLFKSSFALEYLESFHHGKQKKSEALRDVGDKCLIFSGFFPDQAEKRHVPLGYFIKMGQGAYGCLAQQEAQAWQVLFNTLAEHFVTLMDVLQAMRAHAADESPLALFQIWEESHSAYAEKRLEEQMPGKHFLIPSSQSLKRH